MILYLYENDMPTISIFRESIEHDEYLKCQGARIVSVRKIGAAEFNSADLVYFLRPRDVLSYRLADYAKRSGKFVICYCDDDLYDPPINNILDRHRRNYFRKTLSRSNVLATSSPRIAEKYRDFTLDHRSSVGDTTVMPEEIIEHVSDHDEVRIVYAAGPSHKALFEKYVGPILNRLYEQTENRFSLTFVGVHPTLEDINEAIKVEYAPLMSLLDYRNYMRKANFDIGLSPINDDEFSKCKYFNKYFEYSTHGIMGIYTMSEPYTYVVKDSYNGLLAGYDPDDWLEALKKAIDQPELRQNCVKNAQEQIQTQFSPRANFEKQIALIPELQSYTAERHGGLSSLKLAYYRMLYQIERFWFYALVSIGHLKENGLKSFFTAFILHLKERKIFQERGSIS